MAINEAMKHFRAAEAETLERFRHEAAGLRSGRVKPEIIQHIQVEAYGSRSPLNSLASVSSIDARTLAVSPYDKNIMTDIERAITDANLGVNPSNDGGIIRLSFPSLTDDVRKQTLKMLNDKAEEARVRLRQGRDEALRTLKEEREHGEIAEDDFFGGRKKLDELIDTANASVAEIVKKKEEEIQSV